MRAKRVIEGLTIVVLGGTLLANTFGALSWRVWLSIVALWPLLIIAAGVDVVGKGLGREWIRAGASLLVLGGVVWGVAASAMGGSAIPDPARGAAPGRGKAFVFTEPASSAIDRGVATIRGGAGTVTVAGGEALVEVRGTAPFQPQFVVRREATTARIDVGLGSRPWMWPGYTKSAELDIRLSSRIPWDLTIEAGAADLTADLREVVLEKARIDCGVSEGVVTFGMPSGLVPVALQTGVSSVTLRFPRDCAFRIQVTGGLATVEGDGLERSDSSGGARTYTHGGSDVDDRYEVVVQAGVSTVRVALY